MKSRFILPWGLVAIAAGAGAAAGGGGRWFLAVGLAGLIVGLMLVAASPGLFLLALTALYSLGLGLLSQLRLAGLAGANQVLIGAGSGLLVIRMVLGSRAGGIRLERPLLLWGAFVGWALIRAVGCDSADTWPTVGRLVVAYWFLLIGYQFGQHDIRPIDISIAMFSGIATVSALVSRLRSHDVLEFYRIGAVRSGGSLGGAVATAAAAFIGVPVFFKWYLSESSSRTKKLAGLVGLAGTLVSLALTLTRSYMVGLLVFALVLGLQVAKYHQWSFRRVAGMIGIAVALVGGALYVVPEKYVEARFQDVGGVLSYGVEDRAGSGRGRIWREAIEACRTLAPHEIIVGRGLTKLSDDLERRLGYRKDAHNSYLQIFYDLGLLGLLLFCGSLWSIAKSLQSVEQPIWHAWTWRAFIMAYAVSFLLFNAYVYSGPPSFFSSLGIGSALGFMSLRRQTAKGAKGTT